MPFRRSFPRRPMSFGRRRRRFEWTAVAQSAAALNSTNGFLAMTQLVANSTIQLMTEPTLKRIRGELLVIGNPPVDTTGAWAGEVAFGIQVVSKDIVTEFERPFTDAFSSAWLWHQFVPMFLMDSDPTKIGAVGAPTTQCARIVIDSRGQRRVGENDQVILVAEGISGATFTWEEVDYSFGTRILFEQV